MGFMNKLKNKIGKAGHAMANPNELGELDNIVKNLTKNLDEAIAGYENDGTPPTAQQASEWEENKFEKLCAHYDKEARDCTGRAPDDDKDNMAVRRRMLVRKQEARKGALYARFSGDVASLTAKAGITLRACVEELAELEAALGNAMPSKASFVTGEFAALQSRLSDNVEASFPDGARGLDNYDDELPDGVPSWSDFNIQVQAAQERALETNAAAVAEATAAMKAGILAEIESDLAEDIEFMEDDGAELKAAVVEAVRAALGL
ncbi:hypothetical protein B484DRAFT_76437 [Ochromonadaceae sp. CCMP2298]|nr:hypothetical protein B484DRAFT_76437 [Ochromonadaceae sp. CCMP2298]|mmetsp:Transcript_29583/g.65591  ORF Transcript_29583/g.65591 Transcript_29583/m.65591 type:complete len:263 (+) Transcript_29583:91-879(+)|eukprot:CAMPEP_0173305364 /NCGR_PEP_ID=MMETSP1143-20121109/19962_1 /TAXON_ID=483371 /ORGANISM="non described non described, Strain CCMP2298" /LENGTH=262 /DNA_ID=CAMNT_0014246293 /DNA_START=33 /DNA_END=821 /DNA_ORIENTATION=-